MSRPSNLWRSAPDHFEPDADVDPQTQRQLRGHLEQIDYTAYAANRKVVGVLGKADNLKFERLATAAAFARTQWVAAALAATEGARPPSAEQIAMIAEHRSAFEELTEAYTALRRFVERGYLAYEPAPPKPKDGP
jgi:hypothetical protein